VDRRTGLGGGLHGRGRAPLADSSLVARGSAIFTGAGKTKSKRCFQGPSLVFHLLAVPVMSLGFCSSSIPGSSSRGTGPFYF
jgi:hypothetical protein